MKPSLLATTLVLGAVGCVGGSNASGTTVFAMHEATPGVFALSTTLSASAPAGARSFTVTATSAAVGLTVH